MPDSLGGIVVRRDKQDAKAANPAIGFMRVRKLLVYPDHATATDHLCPMGSTICG